MSNRRLSVMVVDDEEELAELYNRFLELSGFNCTYFTNPKMALDYFIKNYDSYSLIITDFKMPDMNGLELAQRLREYNKNIKILLITGFLVAEKIDTNMIKEAGIDMVIEKPFHFKDLRPMIKEILVN